MTAAADRSRNQQDYYATFLMTNVLPQPPSESYTKGSQWTKLEEYLREKLVKKHDKEVYIVEGRDGQAIDSSGNPLLLNNKISVPESVWKVVLVLDRPGQGIYDVTKDTLAFGIYLPNTLDANGKGQDPNNDWTQNFTLNGKTFGLFNVEQLENLTGYNFLSNIPTEIQKAIEKRSVADIRTRINIIEPAPLMAATGKEVLPHTVRTFFDSTIGHGSMPNNIEPAAETRPIEIAVSEVSISQISMLKVTNLSTDENSTDCFRLAQVSPSQISSSQSGVIQVGGEQISIPENSFYQTSPTQISTEQIRFSQISPTYIDIFKISSPQANTLQVSTFKTSNQTTNPISFTHFADDSQQFNPIKVTLPSFITLQQFISSNSPNHNSTSNLVSNINNSSLASNNSPALLNGDFDIANPNDPNYGWNRRGAATTLNSKAILTEESSFNSNFTQTFIIPEGAKTLQFTLTATELGHSELAPPDAFEVALLEANTLTPLVGTSTGLSQTDSFFNLQANDTPYFSNFVKINNPTSSGRTIEVDISHLTPGTLATLYFDLLGFGKRDSRIEIERIRILSDSGEIAPDANDDTATTPQGQSIILNVLANDSDADGTIDPSTLQLVTSPNNGTLILNSNRTFTYTPNKGFVGTDNFTYTIQDNDGLTSLPAVVTLNVTNLPPVIDEIEIEDSITEGTKTTLSAIATDPGNDSLTYTWNLGDGTILSGQQIEHTFIDNGIYTATITVTDVHGASSTKTFNLVVNNSAPIVEAGVDLTINEGQSITLEGNFSDLGLNDTHTITWDFGDGNTVSGLLNPSHTYTQNGTYTATLTVSDRDGATQSDTLTVTVKNVAPTITAIIGETSINQGETAYLSATAFDPGNDPLTYRWDFGDGSQPVNGQNLTYTLTQSGTYELILTVTDSEGASTTQTRTITVNNLAPVINKLENTIANEGEITYFSAGASDPGNDPLTYTWDFGDGSQLVNGQNVTHTFINSGNSNVTLTVSDQYGASTSQTLDLTINNLAPTITQVQGNTNLDEGETAYFSSIASDPGNDPISYIWNFGDGSEPVSGDSVSHQFINNGIYLITLTALDSENAATTQTRSITVNNIAPTVEAGENQTIYLNETITFNGSFSDPGLNDTHTLTWDFGDGTSSTNALNPTHFFTVEGTYHVRFTVIDDFGATSSDSLTVTVKKLPTISVSDVTITESDTNNSTALFTVNLSEASTRPITVNYTTVDGTAKKSLDYLAGSSTLTFAPGQTTQTIAVSILGDLLDEADENFTLELSQSSNATLVKSQGVATIIDNDASPSLRINDLTLTEGNNGTTTATFTVNLSAASGQTVTVNYGTANGTAIAGNDYTAPNGTLTFNPGQTTQTISVQVNGDLLPEANETFFVNLSNPTNATIADSMGVGTIIDNDPAVLPFTIKAEGTVTINGSSDFDGDPLNLNDDARIYAGRGFTINGNPTLPVRRDVLGNPIRDASGKLVLIDRAVAVAPGYNVVNANTNLYANLLPPQVIEPQTVVVPTYTSIREQEIARRIPTSTPTVTFNVQNNPLNTAADWATRFPRGGTATQPTVVRVINGSLNIPANVTLSNLVITIEQGDLNFNGNGHTLNNVMILTNNGNINLSGVQANNVSLFASGSIQMNSNARFSGSSLLANANSNGTINFNGSTIEVAI